MSYLSRRMREDRRPWDEVEIRIEVDLDLSRLRRPSSSPADVVHGLAEKAGMTLTPWQEELLQLMDAAGPDGRRDLRWLAPQARRTR